MQGISMLRRLPVARTTSSILRPFPTRQDKCAFAAYAASSSDFIQVQNSKRNISSKSQRWTAAEEEQIIALRHKGLSRSEIARELGNRTPVAVNRRMPRVLRKSGLEHEVLATHGAKYTAAEDARINELRREKVPWADVAKELNRSIHAVQRRHSYLQLRTQGARIQRYTDAEDRQLTILCLRNEPWSVIRRAFPNRRMQSLVARWHSYLKPDAPPRGVKSKVGRKPSAPDSAQQEWTPALDKALLHMRQELATPWREIQAQLSNKSIAMLRKRYSKLRGIRTTDVFWTGQEDEKLVALRRKSLSWKEIQEEVPQRTIVALQHRYRDVLRFRESEFETSQTEAEPQQ